MIAQGDLPAVAPRGQDRLIANDNFSFGMGDGELDLFDSLQEDAGPGPGLKANPASGVPSVVIPGQRRLGALAVAGGPVFGAAREDPGTHQHLKAVAD